MGVTPELVERIAGLSRLELGPGEARERAAELERVLGRMDALNGLDAAGVEPMGGLSPAKNVLREDEEAPSLDRGPLLAGAPASDGEAFLVPRAVE